MCVYWSLLFVNMVCSLLCPGIMYTIIFKGNIHITFLKESLGISFTISNLNLIVFCVCKLYFVCVNCILCV